VNEGINGASADADQGHSRQKKRRRLLTVLFVIAAAVVLVPVVYVGYLTTSYYVQFKTGTIVSPEERRLQASISRTAANAEVTAEDLERIIPAGIAPELGNRDARVTVIEFIDYLCPFCKRNAPDVRRVMAGMGGQVRFLIRDFPIVELHPNAREAALAANCVLEQGQEPYWRFHDMIFAYPVEPGPNDFRTIAERTNIDMNAFDACMDARRYDRKIDEDIDVGIAAGVGGTPTFFVNGVRFQGVMNESALTKALSYFLENLPQ
jgi:protein-disulfide isomerase